jgi:hypothetical protein
LKEKRRKNKTGKAGDTKQRCGIGIEAIDIRTQNRERSRRLYTKDNGT